MNQTYHKLAHRFAEEVIVPYCALTNNTELRKDCLAKVTCADEVTATVLNFEEKHICDLEEDVNRIYKVSPWDFIKKWHSTKVLSPRSMMFLKIKLSKK